MKTRLFLTVISPPLSVVYVTKLQLYTLYVQKHKLTIFKCIPVLYYVENVKLQSKVIIILTYGLVIDFSYLLMLTLLLYE